MKCTIHEGDVLEGLAKIESGTVQTCVTSPPYWGLRDYGVEGQIGLEPTPDVFVAKMVEVFREVRRCLRDDGTLWLNLGDAYAHAGACGGGSPLSKPTDGRKGDQSPKGRKDDRIAQLKTGGTCIGGLKPKDLCMIPWRVALALQSDGWWLRSVIVWAKKSPMPESVTDRPTSSWEPIFLLAKSDRYYYNAEAVKEPVSVTQVGRVRADPVGGVSHKERGQHSAGGVYVTGPRFGGSKYGDNDDPAFATKSGNEYVNTGFRNQRNVWHLGPEPYAEAHFATFPTEIPRRCIMAGSKPGDLVLDPFLGSGTTLAVAVQLDRRGVGCELNPEYIKLAQDRIGKAAKPNTYVSPRANQEAGGLFA